MSPASHRRSRTCPWGFWPFFPPRAVAANSQARWTPPLTLCLPGNPPVLGAPMALAWPPPPPPPFVLQPRSHCSTAPPGLQRPWLTSAPSGRWGPASLALSGWPSPSKVPREPCPLSLPSCWPRNSHSSPTATSAAGPPFPSPHPGHTFANNPSSNDPIVWQATCHVSASWPLKQRRENVCATAWTFPGASRKTPAQTLLLGGEPVKEDETLSLPLSFFFFF